MLFDESNLKVVKVHFFFILHIANRFHRKMHHKLYQFHWTILESTKVGRENRQIPESIFCSTQSKFQKYLLIQGTKVLNSTYEKFYRVHMNSWFSVTNILCQYGKFAVSKWKYTLHSGKHSQFAKVQFILAVPVESPTTSWLKKLNQEAKSKIV